MRYEPGMIFPLALWFRTHVIDVIKEEGPSHVKVMDNGLKNHHVLVGI